MEIYLVWERRRGTDQIHPPAYTDKQVAEERADTLEKARPRSDGFYVEALEVEGCTNGAVAQNRTEHC